jgi:hypothetical protein
MATTPEKAPITTGIANDAPKVAGAVKVLATITIAEAAPLADIAPYFIRNRNLSFCLNEGWHLDVRV